MLSRALPQKVQCYLRITPALLSCQRLTYVQYHLPLQMPRSHCQQQCRRLATDIAKLLVPEQQDFCQRERLASHAEYDCPSSSETWCTSNYRYRTSRSLLLGSKCTSTPVCAARFMTHGNDGLTAMGGVPVARSESGARSTGVEITTCSLELHGLAGGVINSRPVSLCTECCGRRCCCCPLGDGGGSSGLDCRVFAGSCSLESWMGGDVEAPCRTRCRHAAGP